MRLPVEMARFVRAVGPDHDDVQAEMAAYAREHDFPAVGAEAGGALMLLARLADATRAFEFGSGFGYSAYWFARGMADDGRIVLTEVDRDELEMAREFLDRGGFAERAEFREGDAVAIVDEYEGPFDVVLVDHQKHRYAEAFETVREKVRPGGFVVADNVTHGPIDFDALAAHVVEGSNLPTDDEDTRGIAEYLSTVRAADGFETALLPLGSGLAVSVRFD